MGEPEHRSNKPLRPAAARALAEAAARRAEAERKPDAAPKETPKAAPKETPGRDGPEPTRYGDWEQKGLASDF